MAKCIPQHSVDNFHDNYRSIDIRFPYSWRSKVSRIRQQCGRPDPFCPKYTAFALEILASRTIKSAIVRTRSKAAFYYEYKRIVTSLPLPLMRQCDLLRYPPFEVVVTACYLRIPSPEKGVIDLCSAVSELIDGRYGCHNRGTLEFIDYKNGCEGLDRILYLLLKNIGIQNIKASQEHRDIFNNIAVEYL